MMQEIHVEIVYVTNEEVQIQVTMPNNSWMGYGKDLERSIADLVDSVIKSMS